MVSKEKNSELEKTAEEIFKKAVEIQENAVREKDYTEALKLFEVAGNMGHAESQLTAGICYEMGEGVQINYDTALEWYEKASNQNFSDSQEHCVNLLYKMGKKYICEKGEKKDFAKAEYYLVKAAEITEKYVEYGRLDANIQLLLGKIYFYGDYLKNKLTFNYNKAAERFKKAELKKSGEGTYYYGICFLEGKGVKQNYAEAVNCFREALQYKQCIDKAEEKLAYCYENGLGVQSDLKEAIKLYKSAEAKGNTNAMCALGYYYKTGCSKLIKKDKKKAAELFAKAAEKNDRIGLYELAECYYNGIGVELNEKKAINLYISAAKKNHPGAKYMLALLNIIY